MNDSAKIKYFPKSNLKAFDGMSVTAEVWDLAHNEHRDAMRAHLLSMHGPGIICGLTIRANDPADHYVFISPGAAIDELGRVIVIDQTIAYDFGDEGAGTYMLLVGYAEHEKEDSETKIKIMQHEYVIAARQSLPKQPVVELARLTISRKGAVIRDAADPFQPRKDELDLRFRGDRKAEKIIRAAAVSFPSDNELITNGWRVLSNELARTLHWDVIVDMLPEIDDKINDYDVVYIGAGTNFSLTDTQFALLKNHVNNGKGILLDGLATEGSNALKGLAEKLKAAPIDPENCAFYQEPYFFKLAPDHINEKRLMCGEKVVFCPDALAETWSGELNGEYLSRADIRTNIEWGANLLAYCVG